MLLTIEDMKASELKRKLANAGCTFMDGKKHLIICYKGNRSLMPRHPAKEVTGTDYSVPRRRSCAAWTELSVPGLLGRGIEEL